MHFGVLGTLHILSDAGAVLTIASGKQRLVLALLLIRPNQPLSAEYLLDRLWGDRPPRNARTNLQVYVHRLRQVLGEHRIAHGPGGYRLAVAPHELDALEFERLSAAGRPAEALALWRGDPYADVTDIDELRDEAARLTEGRLTTNEDWYDTELDAGRHHRLIPELQAFVEQNPLRERSRGQLMLALYRSGRTAEALESYRAARSRMIDELGIEPGPDLRRLEQRILEHDPGLKQDRELEAADPAPPARHVPAELPPLSTTFTGRRTEVKSVTEYLTVPPTDGAVTVIAISGPGGVGKSALALQTAHPAAHTFLGGHLYVDLRGSTPGAEPSVPAAVLARLLRSLGVTEDRIPAGQDELAAMFRSLTSAARTLVVLDNAADAAQIRPLLPGAGSAVVATSRVVPSTLDGALHVRLDTLENDASLELLGRLAGRARIDADPEAAAELIQLCGGLPLALRIAGARLAARPDWSIAELAARLADDRVRLTELEHSDLAVRPSFAVSFDALSTDAARVLVHLGVLGLTSVGVPVVAAMAGRGDVRRDLDELIEAQLLQPAGDRYVLHDLVRLFAREVAERALSTAERNRALRDVMAHYVATARVIALRIGGERARWRTSAGPAVDAEPAVITDGDAAADWVRAELANVMQVAGQVRERPGGADLVGSFVAAGNYVLSGLARTAEQITLSRMVLAAGATDQLRTFAQLELALTTMSLRQHEASIHHGRAAVDGFIAIGDTFGEASAAGWLGYVLADIGRFEEAFEMLWRAIEIRRLTGDRFGAIATANQLGLVYRESGNLAEAERVLHDAVLRMRELAAEAELPPRQHVLQAVLLGNLAKVYARTDRPRETITCLEQAADLVTGTGHDRLVPKFIWGIGDAHAQLGDHAEARTRWEQALELGRSAGIISQAEAADILSSPTPTQPAALR
ncbi:BTAD domain-containing putative transcriptional regulator [Kribbella solani]|uniref:AfsR/SARP family transcriptional regulator n=1 Tax=Kribbella solani TaxID=236067 RepID=UPI0029AF3117|nr:BTAD domain-containing putative transcriptional regulator [Kribbella solani]MDX3004403.1 BTAD domain-containing putative transcriptional regulator [Kribbella solani]